MHKKQTCYMPSISSPRSSSSEKCLNSCKGEKREKVPILVENPMQLTSLIMLFKASGLKLCKYPVNKTVSSSTVKEVFERELFCYTLSQRLGRWHLSQCSLVRKSIICHKAYTHNFIHVQTQNILVESRLIYYTKTLHNHSCKSNED
jgi:hypothetical protein